MAYPYDAFDGTLRPDCDKALPLQSLQISRHTHFAAGISHNPSFQIHTAVPPNLLKMLSFASMLLFISFLIILSPLVIYLYLLTVYLQDEKGFRKYPTQNWASGLTPLAYGWECGRPHRDIHSKRLHADLQKSPVIRIAPNWLAFGRSQAARDIYGYTSKCVKAAPYDLLSGGGANLNNISNKSFHSSRRRMVASSYAPKNIQVWEPKVAASITDLMVQMDSRCSGPRGPESFDAVHWIWLFSVEAVIKVMLSKDVFFLQNGTDHIYFNDAAGQPQAVRTIYNSHASQRAAVTVICMSYHFAPNSI